MARRATAHTQNFQGESHEHPDYQPGDLVFRIKTIPHARFIRKENDLYMNATISLLQALVGFKKTYKHLDGHAITIERSGVTRPGAELPPPPISLRVLCPCFAHAHATRLNAQASS